jgi:hypothetical protein
MGLLLQVLLLVSVVQNRLSLLQALHVHTAGMTGKWRQPSIPTAVSSPAAAAQRVHA